MSETIGNRIAWLLNKNHMTQRELARKANVTEPTMTKYIHSKRIPKIHAIIAIADVFGVTTDYLLGVDSHDANEEKTCDKCIHYGDEEIECLKRRCIRAIPSTTDAWQPKTAKIIQCKDCKNWIPYDWMFNKTWKSTSIDNYAEDEIGCRYCDMHMSSSDFCSKAERRLSTK